MKKIARCTSYPAELADTVISGESIVRQSYRYCDQFARENIVRTNY
jgi:hypothetical protein